MASIPSSLRNNNIKVHHAQPSVSKEVAGLDSDHLTMYCFLSLAQSHELEIMPITWEPGREVLGRGASGHVNQSLIDIRTSLAFKTHNSAGQNELAIQELLRAWMLEIAILRHPQIRQHPNVIELEGIAWEINPSYSTILPVLVYQRSQLGTLSMYIERNVGRLSLSHRLKLCFDLASALEMLHSCNVVHGDIKPGNVVIFSEDEGIVVPKLIDFGYSCYGMDDEDKVQIRGTPLWSPPEHTDEDVTIRDAKKMDVYSFGLMCCWILFFDTISVDTGENTMPRSEKLPTGGHDRKNAYKFLEQLKTLESPEEAILEIISQDPTFAGHQSLLSAKFLTQTLQRNPSDRPQDWRELMLVIRKLQGLDPDGLLKADRVQVTVSMNACEFQVIDCMADLDIADFRIRRFVAKTLEETMNHSQCPKCSTNASMQKALCQEIGLGEPRNDDASNTSLLKSGRSLDDFSRYIGLFRNSKHEGLSPRMRKLIGAYSLDLPYTYENHGCLGEAVSECEREIEDRQIVVSPNHPSLLRLKYSLGHIYESLDQWKRAEDLYTQLLEARRIVFGPTASGTLICEVKVASCLANQGELTRSELMLKQTIQKFADSVGEGHKSAIAAMGYLASVFRKQGRFDEEIRILTRQWQISTQVNGEHHVSTLTILLSRALNAFSLGDWKEAEELTLTAINMQKDALGSDDREILLGLRSLCRTYIEQGQFEFAQAIQGQVTKIHEKIGRKENVEAILSRSNLGLILYGQEKFVEAAEVQHSTATTLEKLLGEDHPDTLSLWSDLARTYLRQLKLKEARVIQERVVRLIESAPELSKTYAPVLIVGLANICLKMGSLNDAKENYEKALKLANVIYGSKHPWTLSTRALMANLCKEQHRFDSARDIEEEVIYLMKTELGVKHHTRLRCMRNLFTTYRFLGDLKKAIEIQKEVIELRSSSASQSEVIEDSMNLSIILFEQEKYREAQSLQEKIASDLKTLKGADDGDTLDCRSHLAKTYRALELFRESELILLADVPRHVNLYSEDNPLTLMSRLELAKTLMLQNRWEDATQEYEKVIQVSSRGRLPSNRAAVKARLGIALAKHEQKDDEGAFSMLEEFRLHVKEGGHESDTELSEEAETILLVIIAARFGPRLQAEGEKIEEAAAVVKDQTNTI